MLCLLPRNDKTLTISMYTDYTMVYSYNNRIEYMKYLLLFSMTLHIYIIINTSRQGRRLDIGISQYAYVATFSSLWRHHFFPDCYEISHMLTSIISCKSLNITELRQRLGHRDYISVPTASQRLLFFSYCYETFDICSQILSLVLVSI